ncbi:MAG: hypothetical protein HQ549_07065 [Candidatus Omnitrophica bacterium]|nr:hypothetical protein [Candidatus Omnitrophota bacterium]
MKLSKQLIVFWVTLGLIVVFLGLEREGSVSSDINKTPTLFPLTFYGLSLYSPGTDKTMPIEPWEENEEEPKDLLNFPDVRIEESWGI